jgi:hypothetical protein
LKAKGKEKHTVMVRQLFNQSTFLYDDGKIGSVLDCASSSERRRGEESWRECIPPDTRPAKVISTPDTK